MADQPTPPTPSDHRAEVVAGIRALADLIEARLDLPVPTSVDAQHSVLDRSQTDETVRAAATALGIEPIMSEGVSGISARHPIGGRYGGPPYFATVQYTVHGFLPDDAEQAGGGEQA